MAFRATEQAKTGTLVMIQKRHPRWEQNEAGLEDVV